MNEPVIIDEEFRSIIHKPTKEEFENLESLCLEHGIQDSLKTWHGILVDGHNRYEISQKWDLNYEVCEIDKPDRESVKAWIAKNQLGRRNISDLERIRLARIAKPEIEKEAKKHVGGRPKKSEKPESKSTPVSLQEKKENSTRYKLAKAAGVGEDKFRKGETILDSGNQEIIDAVDSGKMSINKAFGEIKKKEEGGVNTGKEAKEKSKLSKVEPKEKRCKNCGKILPIIDFDFSYSRGKKDNTRRNVCKYCRAKKPLKDVHGNAIKDTGEFSNISEEQIIGNLYDDSPVEITIADVVQEFMANFETAINSLSFILKANNSIISEHTDEIEKMFDQATTKFQQLRKEYQR